MEDGDAFDADTMNDLERRVAAGFTEMDPTGAGGGEVTVQPYTCEKRNGVYALVGICDIAETAYNHDIEYLHISGNTITMKWSGNGSMYRQITLIYY